MLLGEPVSWDHPEGDVPHPETNPEATRHMIVPVMKGAMTFDQVMNFNNKMFLAQQNRQTHRMLEQLMNILQDDIKDNPDRWCQAIPLEVRYRRFAIWGRSLIFFKENMANKNRAFPSSLTNDSFTTHFHFPIQT